MKDKSFWDVLAWIAFAIMALYALGKITGVLNSPQSIDIAAMFSAAYFLGRYAQKISHMPKEIDHSAKDIDYKDIDCIKDDLRQLDRKCPVFKKVGTRAR